MELKMKRLKYPDVADEATLKERFVVQFVSNGPTDRGWEGNYLKCPECGIFIRKGGGNKGCPCGNIFVDSDMFRVSVRSSCESTVETYQVDPR
ncbi:MAG: hypothetical protein DWH91_02370 [Planctomycetota bacterium]|nr:MAG: hypothetical protein DWH91_02370 [Planctomycetota bacterium]